jgi:glycosyltransferase involved in cell wall biosynthesis
MVVILADSIPSMGGTKTFLKNLLISHADKSIPTTLCIPNNSDSPEFRFFVESLGFTIYCLKNRPVFFYRQYFSILFDFYIYLKVRISLKPKLIIATIGTPEIFFGFFLFHKPFIYIIHTVPSYKNYFLFFLIKFKLFSSCNKIVTVSKFSSSLISKKWLIPYRNIYVIYNGVRLPDKVNKPSNLILTVGHVVDYKNPYLWIQCAKMILDKFPHFKFVWAGDGKLLEKMRDEVVKYDLNKNVFFIGLIEDLSYLYENALIYFHPSKIESQGIAIVEAMAYRIPCVTSNCGGIPECVDHGKTGLTSNPEDLDSFFNNISFFILNKEFRESYAEASFIRYNRYFRISSQFEKIISLYGNKL